MSARKRRRVAQEEEEVETPAGGSGLREATSSSREEGESVASESEAALCLDLLPDDILLNVMSLLDTRSVILLSRVCKRFHQLHGNPAVWRDVDLTYKSMDPDKNGLWRSKYLGPYTWRVKIKYCLGYRYSEDAGVLIEDLFAKCPNIRSITLQEVVFKVSLLAAYTHTPL